MKEKRVTAIILFFTISVLLMLLIAPGTAYSLPGSSTGQGSAGSKVIPKSDMVSDLSGGKQGTAVSYSSSLGKPADLSMIGGMKKPTDTVLLEDEESSPSESDKITISPPFDEEESITVFPCLCPEDFIGSSTSSGCDCPFCEYDEPCCDCPWYYEAWDPTLCSCPFCDYDLSEPCPWYSDTYDPTFCSCPFCEYDESSPCPCSCGSPIQGQKGNFMAAFSADVKTGSAPLTVRFYDRSSGDVDEWLWDFGDGGTSGVQNPVHTYTQPGIYDVGLTVTAYYAGSAVYETRSITKDDFITVSGGGFQMPPPVPDQTVQVTAGTTLQPGWISMYSGATTKAAAIEKNRG